MKSQIERYDEALLKWVESTFDEVVPDKAFQVLFAPPDRPYSEVTSGRHTGNRTLKLPRASVSRQDYTFNTARQNQTMVRYCGFSSVAGLRSKQANFPIPVDLPYQIDFWAEYESEIQAYFSHFMRQLYSGIVHLPVWLNPLWQNKITPWILESTINNGTELEPGSATREVRLTFILRCEAFIYDEEPTTVGSIREVKVNTHDFTTQALWNTSRSFTPQLIGTGNGVNKIFTYNLNMAVNKPSVVVYTTIGGNEARGYDDGNLGVITGTQFDTSSINYTTGAVSIIFLTAPDNNAGVYVEYLDDSVTL